MTTDEQGYVPTTEALGRLWVDWHLENSPHMKHDPDNSEAGDGFWTWLTRHNAEQRRLGAVEALREAAEELKREERGGFVIEVNGRRMRHTPIANWLRARADRIEKGE